MSVILTLAMDGFMIGIQTFFRNAFSLQYSSFAPIRHAEIDIPVIRPFDPTIKGCQQIVNYLNIISERFVKLSSI